MGNYLLFPRFSTLTTGEGVLMCGRKMLFGLISMNSASDTEYIAERQALTSVYSIVLCFQQGQGRQD
jgi:hypothetical protein